MTSVAVAPSAVTVVPDSTINMVAIVTAVGGANEGVTWGIDTTSATAGVTISGSGVLTIPADIEGTITVTATSVFDNSKSGTASVSVVSVEPAAGVQSVTLSQHSIEWTAGQAQSQTLTATVVAGTGVDDSVVWASNTDKVIVINHQNSVTVQLVDNTFIGLATITARSVYDYTKYDTCTVSVSPSTITLTTVYSDSKETDSETVGAVSMLPESTTYGFTNTIVTGSPYYELSQDGHTLTFKADRVDELDESIVVTLGSLTVSPKNTGGTFRGYNVVLTVEANEIVSGSTVLRLTDNTTQAYIDVPIVFNGGEV